MKIVWKAKLFIISLMILGVFGAANFSYALPFNKPPYWEPISTIVVEKGQTLSLTFRAIDPEGDFLLYSATDLPSGAYFSSTSRVLTWIPDSGDIGLNRVTLRVTDSINSPVDMTFFISVVNRSAPTQGQGSIFNIFNKPPYFDTEFGQYTIANEQRFRLTVKATDPEGGQVSYSASNLPRGASFDRVSRVFSWTPEDNQIGDFTVNFSARDSANNRATWQAKIYVVDVGEFSNSLNPFSISNSSYAASANYNSVYNSSYYNYGSSYNTGTNNPAYYYTSPSTYSASYGSINNRAPYFTSTNTFYSVRAGGSVSFALAAVDPDGDYIDYQVSSLPTGSFFNNFTRTFSWSPKSSQAGVYTIYFSAVDGFGNSASLPVTISVSASGAAYSASSVSTVSSQSETYSPAVSGYPVEQAETTLVYPGEPVEPQGPLRAFNFKVVADADNNVIVSWDTDRLARGEVLFGFVSHAENPRNFKYDFTTGESLTHTTRHEFNLGELLLDETYYLRAISRSGPDEIASAEVAFVNVAYAQRLAGFNQQDNYTLANISAAFGPLGWMIIVLLLIITALLIYLALKRGDGGFRRDVAKNSDFSGF